jgi:hypothetical protein
VLSEREQPVCSPLTGSGGLWIETLAERLIIAIIRYIIAIIRLIDSRCFRASAE